MDIEGKLRELVLRHLPDEKYFLTEINAKSAGGNTRIAIFLDGDEGIDISVCAQVSREVGKDLEALGIMDHPYTLMVSSPGLDRALKLPRQYHRNKGKKIKVKLKSQKEVKGNLREVREDLIILDKIPIKREKSTEEKIPFSEIETTHVLVSF